MTLIKRSDKGQALTYEEMDGNFTHLGGDGSYQFPSTDGVANQVLVTNGEGQLEFRDQLDIDFTVTDIKGSVYGQDSSLIVDSENNALIGNLTGDMIGSVFADDSTKLVDAVEGKIVGNIDNSTTTSVDLNAEELTVDKIRQTEITDIGGGIGSPSGPLDNIPVVGSIRGVVRSTVDTTDATKIFRFSDSYGSVKIIVTLRDETDGEIQTIEALIANRYSSSIPGPLGGGGSNTIVEIANINTDRVLGTIALGSEAGSPSSITYITLLLTLSSANETSAIVAFEAARA